MDTRKLDCQEATITFEIGLETESRDLSTGWGGSCRKEIFAVATLDDSDWNCDDNGDTIMIMMEASKGVVMPGHRKHNITSRKTC
jgi:hypothetical protein